MLSNWLKRATSLLPACLAQCCFQAFLELFPAFLLRVCAALHGRKVLLNRCRSLVMLALRIFKSRLGFLHRSFPLRAGLRRSSLFFLSLSFAAQLLLFKRGSGAALRLLIDFPFFGGFSLFRLRFTWRRGASSDAALGRSECSLKAASDPTGRRRTMPGFAIAAAITLLSSASFAKPW